MNDERANVILLKILLVVTVAFACAVAVVILTGCGSPFRTDLFASAGVGGAGAGGEDPSSSVEASSDASSGPGGHGPGSGGAGGHGATSSSTSSAGGAGGASSSSNTGSGGAGGTGGTSGSPCTGQTDARCCVMGLVLPDGSVPPIEQVHLHHGTWLSASDYGRGPFFAAGEEKTVAPFPTGYPCMQATAKCCAGICGALDGCGGGA